MAGAGVGLGALAFFLDVGLDAAGIFFVLLAGVGWSQVILKMSSMPVGVCYDVYGGESDY